MRSLTFTSPEEFVRHYEREAEDAREREQLEAILILKQATQFAAIDIGGIGDVRHMSRAEVARRFWRPRLERGRRALPVRRIVLARARERRPRARARTAGAASRDGR